MWLRHPATGSFQCAAGQQYLTTLRQRRRAELTQLQVLTGTNRNNWTKDMTGFVDEVSEPNQSYAVLAAAMPVHPEGSRPIGRCNACRCSPSRRIWLCRITEKRITRTVFPQGQPVADG